MRSARMEKIVVFLAMVLIFFTIVALSATTEQIETPTSSTSLHASPASWFERLLSVVRRYTPYQNPPKNGP